MTPLQVFTSQDQQFQVVLSEQVLHVMLHHARQAGVKETGGILIGHYSADHRAAIITRAEPPPPDSRAGRTWFERGVTGIKETLQRMWDAPQRTFYLGEWHFHPFAGTAASGTDDHTMKGPELRQGFACDEPVLVILGGDPQQQHHVSAYVFPDATTRLPLFKETTA